MALKHRSTAGRTMDVLVTYDVGTRSLAGERRLRKVAGICQAHGQRVQKSVFECRLTAAQLEVFKHQLLRAMDTSEDSIRVYRILAPRTRVVTTLGVDHYRDPSEPIII